MRAVRVTFHPRLDLRHDLSRELVKPFRRGRVRTKDHDRLARITADHDLRIDRHFAEERNAEHFGGFLSAAVTENLFALAAMSADEVAHVLDEAEDGNVDLAEHR